MKLGFAIVCAIAGVMTAYAGAGHAYHERAATVNVLVPLNGAAGELPEGITVPRSGSQRNRIFFTFFLRVQVLRADGSSYEPWATIADPTNRLGLGLATDDDGRIYWAIGALGPGTSPPGIYRIPRQGGTATLLTPADFPAALPDGIDIIGHKAYWTDAIMGTVNVTDINTGATRVWSNDPLLFGNPDACGGASFPAPLGANGISHYRNTIYVTNSNYGRVLRIPIKSNGDAGPVGIVAESCTDLGGLDGIATDSDGTLLATRQPTSSIVRIWPRSGRTTVVYAGAPLDGPASIFIWDAPHGKRQLLITNSTAGSPPGGPGPSIASITLGEADEDDDD